VLHTWGQRMEYHPHLHCVLPGVVMKENGEVQLTGDKYFLPQQALSTVFRAIFLKSLKKLYDSNKLEFFGAQKYLKQEEDFCLLLKKLTRHSWVVYAKKPFAGAQAVLKYLARYTHRIAISNSRLLNSKGGRTTFSYKDYSDNCTKKECTIDTHEFVRRFLLHVLPKQFVRIRHFGFLSNGVKAKSLEKIRKALPLLNILPQPSPEPSCCSFCGGTDLTLVAEIAPSAHYKFYKRSPRKMKVMPMVV